MKEDPVYKEIKTIEWRILLDVNYQWQNLVLGVRYNQALSNFINVQVSSTQVTQARNNSVQLYLRYILWKNKKQKNYFPGKDRSGPLSRSLDLQLSLVQASGNQSSDKLSLIIGKTNTADLFAKSKKFFLYLNIAGRW
jgi:hypothetical protein